MPADLNQRAKAIVDVATSDNRRLRPDRDNDPDAVERGRAGGLKGGEARAKKLTAEHDQRSLEKPLALVGIAWFSWS